MSWQFVQNFDLSDDWQYTQPIEGRYFRIVQINPPSQARMLVAQASSASPVELFDAQKLVTPVSHVLDFPTPPFFTARRIALRKNPLSPSWRVRLEVSPFTASPSPSPQPSPSPTPSTPANLTRDLLSITPGQTSFTLTAAPIAPELSELYLNGVKATYGTEYVINGSQLNWLMPLALQPGDELETIYFAQTGQPQGGLNRQLFTITPGQQQFTLNANPIAPELSELYLNGVKATYGTEYVINGSQLNWLMPLALQPSDELEIYYRTPTPS